MVTAKKLVDWWFCLGDRHRRHRYHYIFVPPSSSSLSWCQKKKLATHLIWFLGTSQKCILCYQQMQVPAVYHHFHLITGLPTFENTTQKGNKDLKQITEKVSKRLQNKRNTQTLQHPRLRPRLWRRRWRCPWSFARRSSLRRPNWWWLRSSVRCHRRWRSRWWRRCQSFSASSSDHDLLGG